MLLYNGKLARCFVNEYVFLMVAGRSVPLGVIQAESAELPELLRHVADFYDDNPDSCEKLFARSVTIGGNAKYLLAPFREPRLDDAVFSTS